MSPDEELLRRINTELHLSLPSYYEVVSLALDHEGFSTDCDDEYAVTVKLVRHKQTI